MAALPGFTGGSFFGVRATDQTLSVELLPTTLDPMQPLSDNVEVEDEMIDEEDDLAAEQAGEDQDEHLVGAFYTVLEMSNDGGNPHLNLAVLYFIVHSYTESTCYQKSEGNGLLSREILEHAVDNDDNNSACDADGW